MADAAFAGSETPLVCLALAGRRGPQVMQVTMAEGVDSVCGPKGRHDPELSAVRHGTGTDRVTLGGRGCRFADPGCVAPWYGRGVGANR